MVHSFWELNYYHYKTVFKGSCFRAIVYCNTNPVFQVRFAKVYYNKNSLKSPQQNGVRAPLGKWNKWCHQSCGRSSRSLRRVPKHLSDLAHCAAEERWIVFSSKGEQYVIVPRPWWRSCRLLSVPSPKRQRRCTAKSVSATQRFLEVYGSAVLFWFSCQSRWEGGVHPSFGGEAFVSPELPPPHLCHHLSVLTASKRREIARTQRK